MATLVDPKAAQARTSPSSPASATDSLVPDLATALYCALETDEGVPRPLGDPRVPDVIRTWVGLAKAVPNDDLDDALARAVAFVGANRAGQARLKAAGILPDIPVQTALIAGYIRMFRRIKAIAANGGLDDADQMAETRREMRALNQRLVEALGALRDQRAAMGRMSKVLVDRERRQARTNVELGRAREDLEEALAALGRVTAERDDARHAAEIARAERDDARRAVEAVRAERDALRRDLNRTRANLEDLKAKYLEKFALALQDLNRARQTLYNDPQSTLPAIKASVAQGYYMILEDMGAGEVAKKLMGSILKDGL